MIPWSSGAVSLAERPRLIRMLVVIIGANATPFGKSDKIASEPVEDAVSPADVSATIFHLLGLDPRTHFHDALGRPFPLSEGKVLEKFLRS